MSFNERKSYLSLTFEYLLIHHQYSSALHFVRLLYPKLELPEITYRDTCYYINIKSTEN